MTSLAFKLLCYFVFGVQILCMSGVVRSAVVCIHPDGKARVETQAELTACHAKQEAENDSAVFDRSCTDSPISTELSATKSSQRTSSLTIDQVPVALPVFLTSLPNLFAKTCSTHLIELLRTVTDVERASLANVILVI